jgi:hypothetical protein
MHDKKKCLKLFISSFLNRDSLLTIVILNFILQSSGCNQSQVGNYELHKILDMFVNVEMIDTVRQGEEAVSWANFRAKYQNISVVYLQDGCAPCYPKYIEWHKRMQQIETANDYTVLFVINARDYTSFTRNTDLHGEIKEKFFYFIDPRNEFIRSNSRISRSILDRSLLIDIDNRIKMVGEPFANADMTKVFHIVTGVDTQHPGESK